MAAWCRHFVRIGLYCSKCESDKLRIVKPTYEELEARIKELELIIKSLKSELRHSGNGTGFS